MSGTASQKVHSLYEYLSYGVTCLTTFYHIEKVSRFFRCYKSLHLDLPPILHKDLQVPHITNGSKSKEDSQAIGSHFNIFILTERKPRKGKIWYVNQVLFKVVRYYWYIKVCSRPYALHAIATLPRLEVKAVLPKSKKRLNSSRKWDPRGISNFIKSY